MLYHQQHWLAKLNHKDVINSSIDIPKVSIATSNFLVHCRAWLIAKRGLSSNASTED